MIWQAVVDINNKFCIIKFESTLKLELADISQNDREECRQKIEDNLGAIFAVKNNNLLCNGASRTLLVDIAASSIGIGILRCDDKFYHKTNDINLCIICGRFIYRD